MRQKSYAPLLLPCLLGLHAVAWGQAAPDAGSVRQQIEQQRPQRLPTAAPTSAKPPAATQPTSGLTVTLQAIRFSGNRLLDDAQLAPVVAGFLNRPLTFVDLQRTADAVAAAYRGAGWLVRVALPEQGLGAGVLTLTIVEARYGGQRFEGGTPTRIPPSHIEALFRAAQPVGQPLNADALDRALLLADDLPGVSVTGTLAAGPAEGETSLLLNASDDPLVSGGIGLDNAGQRSTGRTRLTADLALNSALGLGDQASVGLLHTRGNDYGRVALSLPVGPHGLRVGASASTLSYKTIAGPGYDSAARIHGSSDSAGLDASFPLLRARRSNLIATAAVERRSFVNRDLDVQSDYGTRNLSLGLSGNRFDESGATSGSIGLVLGRLVDVHRHPQQNGIDRSYARISYGLSRQQALANAHSLWLGVSGQYADQVLDSSEKFYIGGASSVRAYPASELGGDRGHVLSAEWRWRPRADLALSSFADLGEVTVLSNTAGEPDATRRLRGYGLSASWQGPAGLLLKATWARRHGNNPLPTVSGMDGDGTKRVNRLWLSANLYF